MNKHHPENQPTEEMLAQRLQALDASTPPSPRQTEFRSAFLASARTSAQRQPSAARRPLVRFALAAAASVTIVAAGLFVSPELRTLAQEIIDFFTRGGSTTEATIVLDGEPVQADNPYPLMLADLEAQASDLLRMPSQLPSGYTFIGGRYDSQQSELTLAYRCGSLYSFGLTIEAISPDQIIPAEVGESADIVDVMIGNQPGQYVRGFWMPLVPDRNEDEKTGEAIRIETTAVWTSDSDFQQLWWYDENQGLFFTLATLSGSMHGREITDCSLEMADFIATASSIAPAQP